MFFLNELVYSIENSKHFTKNFFRILDHYQRYHFFNFFRDYVAFTLWVAFFHSSFFLKFIYLWLHWVFVAARGLSLVVVSGGYSSLQCAGFSLRWLLLLPSTGSRCTVFSSCGMLAQQLWLTGSRAQAQQLWRMGLVAPRHVGSSWTRARTHVPCIGRWILNHCATRDAPQFLCHVFPHTQFLLIVL